MDDNILNILFLPILLYGTIYAKFPEMQKFPEHLHLWIKKNYKTCVNLTIFWTWESSNICCFTFMIRSATIIAKQPSSSHHVHMPKSLWWWQNWCQPARCRTATRTLLPWPKVPNICTWVEWSNYGKVPYSRAQRFSYSGARTPNLMIVRQTPYPLCHTLLQSNIMLYIVIFVLTRMVMFQDRPIHPMPHNTGWHSY